VQVSDGRRTACIDPIALKDLSPLAQLLDNTGILKVFHAASQDLEIFLQATGKVPAPVFDTQLAASLTGHGDQVGYANLVSNMLGVTLDKAHTRSDWSRRPLSPAEIEYAAADVIYLAQLFEKLHAELEQRGRLSWLRGDFAALTDPARYQVHPEDAWERVGGALRLRPNQLKVLRALAAWREETAQRSDRPRKWILADDLLLELARRQPATIDDLQRIRGLPDGVVQRSGTALLGAIATGQQGTAPAVEEEFRHRLPPEKQPVVELLQALVHAVAEAEQISAQALIGRRDLEALAMGRRDLPVLQGWRKEAIGEKLLALVEGRLTLSIKEGRVVVCLAQAVLNS
jgi:ribonuclease D